MLKIQAAAVLIILLAGCGTPQTRNAGHDEIVAPPNRESPAGKHYRIDSGQSELRLLVYRAGAMAALGHNHVIVNHAVRGSATYAGTPDGASFSLTVPVSEFAVDDAAARGEEGADFAQPVPDEAKGGTLKNMLSPALLDAAEFPEIVIESESVTESEGTPKAVVALKIAGHESKVTVPFEFSADAGRLMASGSFTVRQSALGLVPYSLFLGALRVQDEMRVKFKFVATADQASGSESSRIEVPSGAVSATQGR